MITCEGRVCEKVEEAEWEEMRKSGGHRCGGQANRTVEVGWAEM